MPTKKQKSDALEESISITKAFAQGGSNKVTPAFALKELYRTLLELYDEIEETKN